MRNFKLPFIQKLGLSLISLLAIGYLAYLGQTILAPLIFASILAMLFVPLSGYLEQKAHFNRALSTFASLLILLIVLSGLIYFFSSQFSSFSEDIPKLEARLTQGFKDLQIWVRDRFHIRTTLQTDYLQQALQKVLSSAGSILSVTFSMFSQIAAFIAFTILFFIMILNYRKILRIFFISLFAKKHQNQVVEVISLSQTMIKKYIIGLSLQILIVSVMTTIVLTIFGVKYALLLGVLTGLLNVIPYFGIFFSCLLACLVSYATGSSSALWVLVSYIIIHAIDANFILPFVVGSKVKINALISFIALMVGEQLWGIAGMFLCIPIVGMIKIIFEHVETLKPWAILMGEEDDIPMVLTEPALEDEKQTPATTTTEVNSKQP